jgi:hypothetical protein
VFSGLSDLSVPSVAMWYQGGHVCRGIALTRPEARYPKISWAQHDQIWSNMKIYEIISDNDIQIIQYVITVISLVIIYICIALNAFKHVNPSLFGGSRNVADCWARTPNFFHHSEFSCLMLPSSTLKAEDDSCNMSLSCLPLSWHVLRGEVVLGLAPLYRLKP